MQLITLARLKSVTSFILLLLLQHFSLAQSPSGIHSIQCGNQKVKITSKYASYNFKFGKPKIYGKECYAENDSALVFNCHDSLNHFVHFTLRVSGRHYFGLGEQFSFLDFNCTKPFVFTEEQGIGRGDKPLSTLTRLIGISGNEFSSYAPMNFFFSENNTAYLIDGPYYTRYDFTKPGVVGIYALTNRFSIKTFRAESPKSLLTKVTEVTGRMPMLPDWAYGAWLGLQGGQDKVEQVVNKALKAGTPVKAIWIQDWVGRRKTRFGSQLWWTWEADTLAYPDFPGFCRKMKAKDIRVLGYINSFIANTGGLYEEAKAKNYLVKNQKGEDYIIKTAGFPAYLVDLTNPAAFDWFKNVIRKNLIDAGLSGWMADYGEWLPADAKLFSGLNALDYHNQYAVDWARLNREAIQEAGREGDIVFFTRSGSVGSAKYATLFWAGDQMVNWGENDGLPSAVCAMITSGLSGITLNHTDIGGYTTIDNALLKVKRDEELLKRWIEFAAFTPVFRTHEGLKPASNVQFYSNDSIMSFFARFANIHFKLSNYFKFLNEEATNKGLPVIRALLLDYPTDTLTYKIKDEFLLGDDMLVAPVLSKSAKSRDVYFPDDVWINVWTQEEIHGPIVLTVSSDLGSPPVFIKKNSSWVDRLMSDLH